MTVSNYGTWNKGNMGSIVSDEPIPGCKWTNDEDSRRAYGGYVVCESIASEETGNLILAAPDMLKALKECRTALDLLMGDTDLDGDDSLEFNAFCKANAAIDKAEGKEG